MLANRAFQPSGLLPWPDTAPPFEKSVFPFVDRVSFWPGTCSDADPGTYSGQSRPAPLSLTPGERPRDPIPMDGRRIAVNVTRASAPVTGAIVTAWHDPDLQSCNSGASLVVGTTPADGTVRATLPFGSWVLGVLGSGGVAQRVSLTPPDDEPRSVTLVLP